MKNAVTRICASVSLALLTYAPLAAAQTVETFAGGRVIDGLPALETPLMPSSLTTMPDGTTLVVNDFTHGILRRDAGTSLMTAFQVGPASPIWSSVMSVFTGPNGNAYVASGAGLYEIDTATGALSYRGDLAASGTPPCSVIISGSADFAVDPAGAIWFTDWSHNSICRVPPGSSQPARYAGTNTAGFAGDGGQASLARFNAPSGIAVDSAGNVLIADSGNHRIRRIAVSTGIITTIAGTGTASFAGENVNAVSAPINRPTHMVIDGANTLYFFEQGNIRIRRIAANGILSTFAGNGQNVGAYDGAPANQVAIGYPTGLALLPNGDVLLSNGIRQDVRRVTRDTGFVSAFIGNGSTYFCGETSLPRDACLYNIGGVAVDTNGDVYISDSGNKRIRKVSAASGLLTTFAGRAGTGFTYTGEGGPAADVYFNDKPTGLWMDATGNLYVAGGFMYRVFRIDRATGNIATIAGTGVSGFSGDGGPATAAKFNYADSVAVDAAGNVFFSDSFGHRVRKIAAGSGIISTYAGTGSSSGALGDGGAASEASLSSPMQLGFDRTGSLLILDNGHNRIRRVDKTSGIITTTAGNGTFGNTGDGGPANLASIAPGAFVTDPAGNLITINGTPRRIDANTGIISTVPGVPTKSPEGFSIGGRQLSFDAIGRLYSGGSTAVVRINGLPYALGDSTPPQIQPNISGALGVNGWYTGDVQVTWNVTDDESAISSKTGCDAALITQDSASLTITCAATSGGGTNSNSITLKRDATPPQVAFGAKVPAANANGWNGSDVSIPFTTSDETSGVADTSLPSPLSFTNEGMGVTQAVTVTDVAGNSATLVSPPVSIDKSAPQVTADVTGTPGDNGWYRGPVEVAWSVTEIPASIVSSSGCDSSLVSADTAGSTFTCSVTSAGGTTIRSTSVKLDATPPALQFGPPTPAPNAFGWYNYDTSVPFTVDDATSGVVSSSQASPLTLANEGVGLRRSVTVTDAAGNSAGFTSPAINIDKTGPVVAPVVTGTLGNNDWYVSDVTVSWSIIEMPESLREIYGCETGQVTTDTDGVMFGCVVNSQGGGIGMPQWIKRDTTPATVQWGTASPAPNANGWNKTNVSVPYTVSDALSGVAGSTSGTAVITGEGAGIAGHATVTDKAGNVATIDTPPRNIDRTPPVVTITTPASGASYGLYQDVYADFACTDISLLSCTGTNAEGAAVNTRSAGSKTFKVTAKDSVALTTAVTNSFTVASTFNFDGFLGAAPSPAPNIVRKGSLVPLRWRLPDGHGGYVTSTASYSSVASTTVSCPAGAVAYNDTATGGSGISFNAATNAFTYNWQSSASFTGCKQIFITLKDGTQHDIVVKFQ